jgi:hypothetical protein
MLLVCIFALICSGAVLNIEGYRIHSCIELADISACFLAKSSNKSTTLV